jgi:HPt (histidine-containing phosphotransfer) domain-containing protein
VVLTESELDRGVIDALRELPSPDGRSMVACVAELFTQDSPALLRQMQQSAEREDWVALATAAHALKSYAGNVGALRFMAQLRELELAAKAGDGPQCVACLAPVPEACSKVVAALAQEAARP